MKTTYTIIEAHSGTNKNEIEKAKRLFLAGIKKGMYSDGDIEIKFADVNNVITATFRDADSGELIDTVEIWRPS